MLDAPTWRRLFRLKGLYNCIAPWVVLAAISPPGDRLYFHLFLAPAFCFGIGYWEVGRNLTRNRAGVGGQTCVCVFGLAHVFAGPLTPAACLELGASLTDGAFALLFARFLMDSRWRAE